MSINKKMGSSFAAGAKRRKVAKQRADPVELGVGLVGEGRYSVGCSSCFISDGSVIRTLVSHGCFGTGLLSRSKPTYFVPPRSANYRSRSVLAAPFFGQPRLDVSPPVLEPLVLTAEETFYLFSVKQALTLHRSGDDRSSVQQLSPTNVDDVALLWRDFATADLTFVKRYCAYQHYRELGWIPRSGLKYGTDFLLYEYAPDVDHAAYQVIVVAVDESTGGLLEPLSPHGAPHWRTISTVNRIAAGVLKRMVICYITFPNASVDFCDSSVASTASLNAVVVKRWAPHRARPPTTNADPGADEDDLEHDDCDEDSFG